MADTKKDEQKKSFLDSNIGYIIAGVSLAIGIYLIVSAVFF